MARNLDTETDVEQTASNEISRRQTLKFGGLAMLAALTAGILPFDAIATNAAAAAEGASEGKPFEMLVLLYPTFTLLDFAGINEVFQRLVNVKLRIATPDGGAVTSDTHVVVGETERLADVASCDLICVVGGTNRSSMMKPEVQGELRRLAGTAKYITSVCNGSLILGAAGLLKGKRSACHWAQRNLLKQYGAIPDSARVVRDGNFISGGGVTAGIDFALTVAAELRGPIQAQVVQLLMEYDPAPPFQSGNPEKASPEVLQAFVERYPSLAASAGLQAAPKP